MHHKLPWDQTIWEGGWTPLGFNHRVEEMKEEKTRRGTGGEKITEQKLKDGNKLNKSTLCLILIIKAKCLEKGKNFHKCFVSFPFKFCAGVHTDTPSSSLHSFLVRD